MVNLKVWKSLSVLMVLMLIAALAATVVPASPVEASPPQTILWGVTGVNFGAANEYSQVFKVDTTTGAVTIVRAVEADPLYSDIAVTSNGNMYVIGRSTNDNVACPGGSASANFDDFYRLNPNTGTVIQAWENAFTVAGFRHVNALTAVDDTTLLAIEGGGICPGWSCPESPKLLQIKLDGAGNLSNIISLGVIAASGAESMCCDGDLDKDPTTGKWYAGFWANAGSEMVELNLANPGASTLRSQSNIQWQGGFAFLSNGTAYAGCWADKKLYTVNVTGGGSAVAYDLSAFLAGNIFGLSSVPPTEVWVATTGNDSNPGTQAQPFATIQHGINIVCSGGTVHVAAGTYDEQVVINKATTLQGAGDTTIVKPSSAANITQVFNGLFWYGTPDTKNVAGIIVANVPDGSMVTVSNLKIDESLVTTKPTGADYLAGVFYRETGGTVDTVTVLGTGEWSGGGTGLMACTCPLAPIP